MYVYYKRYFKQPVSVSYEDHLITKKADKIFKE